MGWFSDLFRDNESPKQGFFESNKDYRDRVYLKGKERITEELSGSKPKQGFSESDADYRSRIAHESNERIVEVATDSKPKQGFFESDADYRSRVHHESNERLIEGAAGSKPSQGFFESDEKYHARISHEANEKIVEAASGTKTSQGFFESDDDYSARISQEAKEAKASDGGGSDGCFITTACVKHAGLSDDCHELETLRQFRDGYIAKLPNGDALISKYYRIAPEIVNTISLSPRRDDILRDAFKLISRAVLAIESGENKIALDIYLQMVNDLRSVR